MIEMALGGKDVSVTSVAEGTKAKDGSEHVLVIKDDDGSVLHTLIIKHEGTGRLARCLRATRKPLAELRTAGAPCYPQGRMQASQLTCLSSTRSAARCLSPCSPPAARARASSRSPFPVPPQAAATSPSLTCSL